MNRMLTTLVAVAALLVTMMAGVAAADARGVSPEKLQNAGWECFDNPLGTHCTQGGLDAVFAGEANTIHVMVFDLEDGEFLGTELLVHDDVFNDQPCPQDGGEYFQVTPVYWACHHYETPHVH